MSNDLRAFVCDFQIDKLEFICYLVLRIWCLPEGLIFPSVF
jgi:hypothetical protein